jgi:hypothetical protein
MLSNVPIGTPNLTTPFGMLRYAEDYRLAAELAQAAKPDQPSMPAYNSIGIAIELALKAFLLRRGVGYDELRVPPLGHNLDKLFALATQKRLDRLVRLTHLEADAISVLNKMYSKHQFRYIKTGSTTAPRWLFIASASNRLNQGLHDTCLRHRIGKEKAKERIRNASRKF